MTDDQDLLTPSQERAIERLQLVGVVLLLVLTIGIGVLDKLTTISNWKLAGFGFTLALLLLAAATAVVGHIEGRSARGVARRALRETGGDLSKQVARLRRR